MISHLIPGTYLQWLQLNHPEGSDRNLSDYFSDVPPAEPLQLETSINISLSSPYVSNSEHNNTDDTQSLSHCDISCRSTDVTLGLTSMHISTQPISPLADAVSLPEQSTLPNKSIAAR